MFLNEASKRNTIQYYYRITYNGNGIFEELKKELGYRWKYVRTSDVCNWLPRPSEYNKNYKSYFTKDGYRMFRVRSLEYCKKILNPSKIEIEKIKPEDLKGEIVYYDDYQIVLNCQNINNDDKISTFENVKEIYESLTEQEKKFVCPSGRFVDSPHLVYRKVEKGVLGYIEAYNFNGTSKNTAFVTLAVRKEGRGKGLGKKLLINCALWLKANGFKKLMYRLDKENIASEHLIKSIKESYLSSETKTQKTYFIDLNTFEPDLKEYKIMDESSQPILFSDDDVEYRLDDFMDHKVPVLYITGMSGGGKTTTAYRIFEELNCDLFQIDHLEEFVQKFINNDVKGINKFLDDRNFRVIYEYIKRNSETGYKKDRSVWMNFICDMVELITKIHSNEDSVIIEGVQIPYVFFHKSYLFDDVAIIIKGTSMITSIIRRYKRDRDTGHFINKFSDIKKYMKMYYEWYKSQNEFRNKIEEK